MISVSAPRRLAVAWLFMVFAGLVSGHATAGPSALDKPILIGEKNATHNVRIYAQLGCRGCATLFGNLLDAMGKDGSAINQAVKNGRLAFQYRIVPSDKREVWAEALARCSNDTAQALRRMFATNGQWLKARFSHTKGTKRFLIPERMTGFVFKSILVPDLLSEAGYAKCLADQDAIGAILNGFRADKKTVSKVLRYPAAFVDGKLVVGADKILDAISAQAAKD